MAHTTETEVPQPRVGTDEYTVWFWLQQMKHLRDYTKEDGAVTDPDLHEDLRELRYEDAMAAFGRILERLGSDSVPST
jgi:hypothetical protein